MAETSGKKGVGKKTIRGKMAAGKNARQIKKGIAKKAESRIAKRTKRIQNNKKLTEKQQKKQIRQVTKNVNAKAAHQTTKTNVIARRKRNAANIKKQMNAVHSGDANIKGRADKTAELAAKRKKVLKNTRAKLKASKETMKAGSTKKRVKQIANKTAARKAKKKEDKE